VDEAWAELLGALAAAASQCGEASAPVLEEVVLAVGEQQQDDGHAKSAAACLAGVVQGALPGVSVSWG
jgi:hypothetical protein